jgi:hypothetical protein
MPECFFAHLGGCEGRLVKAHLIPKQRIRKEFPGGAVFASEGFDLQSFKWRPFDARVAYAVIGNPGDGGMRSLQDIVWDPRCWRWMCGGPTGLGGHHGAYDAKQIGLDEWPPDLIEFLREYGIEWMAEAYAR